jgi:chromosome segregation ATPase
LAACPAKQLEEVRSKHENEHAKFREALATREKEIASLQEEISTLRTTVLEVVKERDEKKEEVVDLTKSLGEATAEVLAKQDDLEKLWRRATKKVKFLTQDNAALKEESATLRAKGISLERKIASLQTDISEACAERDRKNELAESVGSHFREALAEILAKRDMEYELRRAASEKALRLIDELRRTVTAQEQQVAAKDDEQREHAWKQEEKGREVHRLSNALASVLKTDEKYKEKLQRHRASVETQKRNADVPEAACNKVRRRV